MKKNLRREIYKMKIKLDLGQDEIVSDEDKETFKQIQESKQPLPDDIIYDSNNSVYYRYMPSNLTKDEFAEYMQLRSLRYLQTIKVGVQFFVVITLIGLLFGVIIALS